MFNGKDEEVPIVLIEAKVEVEEEVEVEGVIIDVVGLRFVEGGKDCTPGSNDEENAPNPIVVTPCPNPMVVTPSLPPDDDEEEEDSFVNVCIITA